MDNNNFYPKLTCCFQENEILGSRVISEIYPRACPRVSSSVHHPNGFESYQNLAKKAVNSSSEENRNFRREKKYSKMDLTFWMNPMWLDIDLERNIHTVFIQSAAKGYN